MLTFLKILDFAKNTRFWVAMCEKRFDRSGNTAFSLQLLCYTFRYMCRYKLNQFTTLEEKGVQE